MIVAVLIDAFLFVLGLFPSLHFSINFFLCVKAFVSEIFVLFYHLSQLLLSDQALNQFFMFICCLKSGETFHHIVYLFFVLGPQFFEIGLFFKVKETPTDHKLLPFISFREPFVVNFDGSEFQLNLFRGIFFVELHLSKEEFGLVVVLELETLPEGHVADDLDGRLFGVPGFFGFAPDGVGGGSIFGFLVGFGFGVEGLVDFVARFILLDEVAIEFLKIRRAFYGYEVGG